VNEMKATMIFFVQNYQVYLSQDFSYVSFIIDNIYF